VCLYEFMPFSQGFCRRQFLKLTGLAAVGLFLPRNLLGRPEDFFTVSILHTTDLHGHILPTVSYDGLDDVGGFARCASQIRMWQRQSPFHLLVDAGDVYQGTEAGFRTRGQQMIDCFNLLGYDGWAVGNHEFDWGVEAVRDAVRVSQMPVLTSNVQTYGEGWENIRPWTIKTFEDFRVGIIGVTTPGLPYWFRPEFLKGFEVEDPLDSVRRSIRELKAEKVDAIVLLGHMGLRLGGDDFANRTEGLLEEFPEVVAFVGGHTHRDVPDQAVHGRPFTQASYHGIHCGRLDLVFERSKLQLVGVHPTTMLMDGKVEMDPAVLDLTATTLEESEKALASKVGTLGQTLSIENSPGKPSQLEELIGLAVSTALRKKQIDVDAVFHGMFWPKGPVEAGPKTVADIWEILPYENFLVTAELNREQLTAILEENFSTRGFRSLIGMEVELEGRGASRSVTEIFLPDGTPMERGQRVKVVFNTFDAQSAGQRLMRLREILQQPECRTTLRKLQTRTALIEYFTERDVVRLPA